VRRPPVDGPFVHVGRAGDPDLRWLADAPLPPEPCGYVLVGGEPTLFVPPGVDVAATGVRRAADPTVAVAEALPDGPVAAPRHLPHDAALRVEDAGCDLRSTTAVADARATKTDAEVRALAEAAACAAAGVERARATLDGGDDAEGLRRRVASAVAGAGATPSVVVEGSLAPGAPVVVDARARVEGYRAQLCRTLVPDGDGGPVRRAHVACESALRVAAREADPGTDVDWLASEVRAELSSFGVEAAAGTAVAGTGLARREAPRAGDTLAAGHAVVVAPATRVPNGDGVVRLADTLVVEAGGGRALADAPTATR
jgi:Xaa-Pro aminopeptidase